MRPTTNLLASSKVYKVERKAIVKEIKLGNDDRFSCMLKNKGESNLKFFIIVGLGGTSDLDHILYSKDITCVDWSEVKPAKAFEQGSCLVPRC